VLTILRTLGVRKKCANSSFASFFSFYFPRLSSSEERGRVRASVLSPPTNCGKKSWAANAWPVLFGLALHAHVASDTREAGSKTVAARLSSTPASASPIAVARWRAPLSSATFFVLRLAYIISVVAFFLLESASMLASGSSQVRILTAGRARMIVRPMKRRSGTRP